jgi:L-2-hydroxyglutarate oxidase
LKTQLPDAKVLVLEKETQVGQHQTGHNSGVIHSGIYYEPGSLKAELCRAGVEATVQFCETNGLPFERCGKLIVATNEDEHSRMLRLYERGQENKLEVELLNADELRKREPRISGNGAIFVPATGITNYVKICERMTQLLQGLGGEIWLGGQVSTIDESDREVTVQLTDGKKLKASFLIACAGLQADRIAAKMRIPVDFQIVPYRGEYFRLPPALYGVVEHLIYPVPNPELPFLGVHLTRMIDGSITVGPNAVQGWKREGYGRFNASPRDLVNLFSFPGFWRATLRHLRPGMVELKNSLWRRGYLREVQKYCPSIKLEHLRPHPAGIRAQAVMRNGDMVHDFLFASSPRSLHVCNAPSPAATSAIPIAKQIIKRALALSAS